MSARSILFIDRDGTLIKEPPDEQVDRIDKIALVDDSIPALLALRDAGYEFVLVSNQDGLGTDAFPQIDFDVPHEFMLTLFASQGVSFAEQMICPHLPADGCGCRKPNTGLLTRFLAQNTLDLNRCAVIGDRETDIQLADNIGIRGFLLDDNCTWNDIAHQLINQPRTATLQRNTNETHISVIVDLDAPGPQKIQTGIGFFDHMLEQIAKHGGFALTLDCEGDLDVDDHHCIEDVALALGQTLRDALGDKRGIGRYGFTVPMDETLATVAVDISGRPAAVIDLALDREFVGGMATEMVRHFFESFAQSLGAAIHISVTGDNAHHKVEACFKGLGRALRPALQRRGTDLPSTKGTL
ncbi:MAG: bifunctional histidinol-phosphatase/imidazoleglycerol-phosphate dehydratase HisB [Pseudomonadota bacterium]